LEGLVAVEVEESLNLILNVLAQALGLFHGFALHFALFTLVLLSEGFFLSAAALHIVHELIAFVNLHFQVV